MQSNKNVHEKISESIFKAPQMYIKKKRAEKREPLVCSMQMPFWSECFYTWHFGKFQRPGDSHTV